MTSGETVGVTRPALRLYWNQRSVGGNGRSRAAHILQVKKVILQVISPHEQERALVLLQLASAHPYDALSQAAGFGRKGLPVADKGLKSGWLVILNSAVNGKPDKHSNFCHIFVPLCSVRLWRRYVNSEEKIGGLPVRIHVALQVKQSLRVHFQVAELEESLGFRVSHLLLVQDPARIWMIQGGLQAFVNLYK